MWAYACSGCCTRFRHRRRAQRAAITNAMPPPPQQPQQPMFRDIDLSGRFETTRKEIMPTVNVQSIAITNKVKTRGIDPDNMQPENLRCACDSVFGQADGGVFNLLREGRLTTQVACDLYEGGEPPANYDGSYAIYPADWFVVLHRHGGGRPAVGRETGFVHWTRKGWDANLQTIETIWAEQPRPRGTLEELLQKAAKTFDERDIAYEKYQEELSGKLDMLRNTLV